MKMHGWTQSYQQKWKVPTSDYYYLRSGRTKFSFFPRMTKSQQRSRNDVGHIHIPDYVLTLRKVCYLRDLRDAS